MVFFIHPHGCKSAGARRTAVTISAIAAALGALVSSLLKHGWNTDEPGVDPTWRFISLGACALVIVVGVGLLLIRWRRHQEGE